MLEDNDKRVRRGSLRSKLSRNGSGLKSFRDKTRETLDAVSGKQDYDTSPEGTSRGKPLLCIQWIHMALIDAFHEGRLDSMRLHTIENQAGMLMEAYNGMDRINKNRFPLPYAQLTKLFTLCFTLTLPLAIYAEMESMTAPVCALVAIGFYGIDAIGEMLETPYGTESCDIPVDAMGLGLIRD